MENMIGKIKFTKQKLTYKKNEKNIIEVNLDLSRSNL